jgi:hypothetical protein
MLLSLVAPLCVLLLLGYTFDPVRSGAFNCLLTALACSRLTWRGRAAGVCFHRRRLDGTDSMRPLASSAHMALAHPSQSAEGGDSAPCCSGIAHCLGRCCTGS